VTPQFTLSGYYGHARGGRVVRSIYASKTGQLGYVEATYRF
jgi:hypothetical protein